MLLYVFPACDLQYAIYSSNLFNSFHAEQVEADGHDLADRIQKQYPARLLRRILHTNSANERADLDSDVIDEITDAIYLQIPNGKVELLRQAQNGQGEFTLLRIRDRKPG